MLRMQKDSAPLTRKEVNRQRGKKKYIEKCKDWPKENKETPNSKVTKVFYGTPVRGLIGVYVGGKNKSHKTDLVSVCRIDQSLKIPQ